MPNRWLAKWNIFYLCPDLTEKRYMEVINNESRKSSYVRYDQIRQAAYRIGFIFNSYGITPSVYLRSKNNGYLILLGFVIALVSALAEKAIIPGYSGVYSFVNLISLFIIWSGLKGDRERIAHKLKFAFYRGTLEQMLAEYSALSFQLWGNVAIVLALPFENGKIDTQLSDRIASDTKEAEQRGYSIHDSWYIEIPKSIFDQAVDARVPKQKIDSIISPNKDKDRYFVTAQLLFENEDREWTSSYRESADDYVVQVCLKYQTETGDIEVVLISNHLFFEKRLPKTYAAFVEYLVAKNRRSRSNAKSRAA